METTELLKKIRKIEISTKSLVSEIFSGEYHSIFKGQGLEFSEVREYQIGDSFRQIDWNVSAKMGSPYIKKFEETRELNLIFLVDASASTLLGTKGSLKSEIITEITSILSFSALSNNDKVGLLLFTDEPEIYLPPRKGKKYALRMIRDILYFTPKSKKTSLKTSLEYIYKLIKKKSIIFLISDFIDSGYEKSLKLLARKHDLIALKITDPVENMLPSSGFMEFYDSESGENVFLNTSSKKNQKKYFDYIEEEKKEFESFLKKNKIDLINIQTDKPYLKELIKFFKHRAKAKTH